MNKSQFFKYLANGGRVKMITWHGEAVPEGHALSEVRQVAKVQTNGVQFEGGSWLMKDDIQASDVHEVAAGGERPAVSVGWAVYQLIDGEA